MRLAKWWLVIGLVIAAASSVPANAETVKVGLTKQLSYAGVPIALQRGYFKEQGLDVQLVYFISAEAISVGVTSGDVDFGISGLSAAFYTLAAHGQLRLLAASASEEPGFYNFSFVASNRAYDAGLKSVKDLPGHEIAITQLGTSLHYSIGLAAEKFGFPMSAVTVRPMQSTGNAIAALSGGTVSAALMPSTPTLKPVAAGKIKRIAWVGDITPGWMGSALFTASHTANERGDLVKRFLIAYRKGTHDYHAAFTNSGGKRQDGPDAAAMLKLLSDFTGVPAAVIDQATPFIDSEARVSIGDVAHQIAWYKAQGFLKGELNAEQLVDLRYATTMK